jgi:hypothetical protein
MDGEREVPMPHRSRFAAWCLSIAIIVLASAPAGAIKPPKKDGGLEKLAFSKPELHIPNAYKPVASLPAELGAEAQKSLDLLGAVEAVKPIGFYDVRAGKLGSIILSKPLVAGAANGIPQSSAAAGSDEELGRTVSEALRRYVTTYRGQLGIDPADLSAKPDVTVL